MLNLEEQDSKIIAKSGLILFLKGSQPVDLLPLIFLQYGET